MSRASERSWIVGEGEAGWRLDAYLAAVLGASRAEARRVLERGAVAVEGRPVGLPAKGSRLTAGATVAVAAFTPPAARVPLPDPDAPLSILARGAGWVAVDKPAGTPVHPLDPTERGTVLNALVARHPEIVGVGEGGLRSGVVHRLDVDTSGVLLFATETARFRALRLAFRRHRIAKTYRALVAGRLEGEGELVLHLAVARHRPARVRVVSGGEADFGRRSRRTLLRYRSVEMLSGATLVEVQPFTGFLHQIRVSLAHLGHPVVGDTAYGTPAPPPGGPRASRQMLHAARVQSGDVDVSAPDPADFRETLASLLPPPPEARPGPH